MIQEFSNVRNREKKYYSSQINIYTHKSVFDKRNKLGLQFLAFTYINFLHQFCTHLTTFTILEYFIANVI